jgi:hypothetical protein
LSAQARSLMSKQPTNETSPRCWVPTAMLANVAAVPSSRSPKSSLNFVAAKIWTPRATGSPRCLLIIKGSFARRGALVRCSSQFATRRRAEASPSAKFSESGSVTPNMPLIRAKSRSLASIRSLFVFNGTPKVRRKTCGNGCVRPSSQLIIL